uniref:DNA repair-scaffolding protein n=1 Tax=Haemonchus contortus TaxID=6289 RepID=A0A7I4Y563_HAECO
MEAAATGISPSWKNPRERLRKHLKRASSSRSLAVSFDGTIKESSTNADCRGIHSRSNPFKRSSPMKKRRKQDNPEERVSFDVSTSWDDSNANDPFSNESVLRKSHSMKRAISNLFVEDSDHSLKECFATDFSDIFCGNSSASTVEIDTCCSDTIPSDLRLGTKLRVIARKPYMWMRDTSNSGVVPVRVTGQQRHEGLQVFLNCVGTDFLSRSSMDVPSGASPISLLEAACLYWQFPCLPWLTAFPRIDSLVNAGTNVTDTMTECFDQLFLSWKKGDRKSFYMSCSSFTVLFTKVRADDPAPGEDSSSCFQASDGLRHVAIITPSTIGFRQYLKSEGIEFEVLRRKTRSKARTSASFKFPTDGDSRLDFDWQGVTQSQPPLFSNEQKSLDRSEDKENTTNGSDSDKSPEKADSSGDHEWLETIGMSPRKSAKLKRYKSLGSSSNLADIGQSKLDFEEVAAVLVKGADLQTLYNLLQSSRVCRSIAGPHAKLPPTLTAAQPFNFAQLLSLKKSSQVIRRKEVEYVLELEGGPVMPHCIPLIVELIRRTGLCKDDVASIRVSDRAHCNGINEADTELCDWNEIRVSNEKFEWDKL